MDGLEPGSSVEEYLDNVAYSLQSCSFPAWFQKPEITTVFRQRATWDAVVAASPICAALGLDTVLASRQGPGIEFFQSLPQPSSTKKQWADYAMVLHCPGQQPMLYIGSGTDAEGRVQTRWNGYRTGNVFASRIEKALKQEGCRIASFGLLSGRSSPGLILCHACALGSSF